MPSPQPIQYRDVDDLLSQLPTEEREIVQVLRHIIFASLPGVREKLAYNVPFFYLRKRFAFIWPASVPWGKMLPGDGVDLGFTRGADLPYQEVFKKPETGQIRRLNFKKRQDIDEDLVRFQVMEAAALDENAAR